MKEICPFDVVLKFQLFSKLTDNNSEEIVVIILVYGTFILLGGKEMKGMKKIL